MKLLPSFLFIPLIAACAPHYDPCLPPNTCNPQVEYCRCENTNDFHSNNHDTVRVVLPDFPPVVDNGEGSSDVNDDDWDAVSDDSNGDNSDE